MILFEEKMNELISVIVPIYRVEKYLEQCIESIINQTYKNLEIILVDDGSDDNCGEICDKYAQIDERIKVIHKKNAGLNNARKSGIEIATGKYIGYVDGDDWIEPEMYEKLLEVALKYGVDVVEAGYIESNDFKERKIYPYLEQGEYKDEKFLEIVDPIVLYVGDFFQSAITPYLWNKIFLREKLIKYQLMNGEIQNILNDNLVTYPTVISTKSLYVLHKCLYHYRLNNNSIKHTVNNKRDIYLIHAYEGYKSRLKDIFLAENADKQIQFYCMYHLLCRIPFVFDDINSNKYLTPYGKIDVKSKIVLYGAGAAGIHLYHYIVQRQNTNLVGWVDKNNQAMMDNYDVRSPEHILYLEFDYIVISVMKKKAVNEIFSDLVQMGIDKKKILWISDEYLADAKKLLDYIDFK